MPDDRVSEARELASLFPQPRTVTIAGRSVELKRCGIAQAGRIIDAAWPLYEQTKGDIEILPLFEERPTEIAAILVAATGLDAEWIGSLDPLDKFALATAWMEVNGSFFVRRLLPPLATFMATMVSVGSGPTSSTSSSSTGI